MNELTLASWLTIRSESLFEDLIRKYFGSRYRFGRWVEGVTNPAPVFADESELEWVLAPSGSFSLGISEKEIKSAMSLSREPLLTLGEMLPVKRVETKPFLILKEPLSAVVANKLGVNVVDTIGPRDIGLFDYEGAIALARKLDAHIPEERYWEYACRGGTQTLFWFGNKLPPAADLPHILGLELPEKCNDFGLSSMFHGEWCSDVWRSSYSSLPESGKGHVIRGGGASRFWPWQDEREWAGCVSAFRMPSEDMGGAGAAVRLLRPTEK